MENLGTTKLSSKGQVVIPENIRKILKLQPGTQFIVLGEKDAIILKKITPPTIEEFETLINKAKKAAKKAGLKKSDIENAIKKVRSNESSN